MLLKNLFFQTSDNDPTFFCSSSLFLFFQDGDDDLSVLDFDDNIQEGLDLFAKHYTSLWD